MTQGDTIHKNDCAGNANTRLQAGSTGTSQFSPYKLELRGNGTVGTYYCDHKLHAGATRNTHLSTKQPSESNNKILLLELWDPFHSREKNLISK